MTIEHPNDYTPRLTEEERAAKIEEEGEVIKLRLNKEERLMLDGIKKLIGQPKDGTALKQCLEIATTVVGTGTSTGTVLRILLGNRKRAARLGIPLESPYL